MVMGMRYIRASDYKRIYKNLRVDSPLIRPAGIAIGCQKNTKIGKISVSHDLKRATTSTEFYISGSFKYGAKSTVCIVYSKLQYTK